MVTHEQGIPIPEEQSETRKLLDCLRDARHGAGEQRTITPQPPKYSHSRHEPHNRQKHGENHHPDTPKKNGVFHNESSHSHTHDGEGDPLALLDRGTHEFFDINAIDLIQA